MFRLSIEVAAALALSVAALLAAMMPAPAQDSTIVVEDAYARPSLGAGNVSAAYLTIDNRGGEADRLVGVSTDAAERAELHTHVMENDIARMRPVDGIELPAGGEAKMAPGGLHIMLMGARKKLTAGDVVTLELRFEKSPPLRVEVPVRALSEIAPDSHQHDGGNG